MLWAIQGGSNDSFGPQEIDIQTRLSTFAGRAGPYSNNWVSFFRQCRPGFMDDGRHQHNRYDYGRYDDSETPVIHTPPGNNTLSPLVTEWMP